MNNFLQNTSERYNFLTKKLKTLKKHIKKLTKENKDNYHYLTKLHLFIGDLEITNTTVPPALITRLQHLKNDIKKIKSRMDVLQNIASDIIISIAELEKSHSSNNPLPDKDLQNFIK